MPEIIGKVIVAAVPFLMLCFYLAVDPKGVMKAVFGVLVFILPPVVLGIIFGGLSCFVVLILQILMFPLLMSVRQIIRCCIASKKWVRTAGKVVGFERRKSKYLVNFQLPDGNWKTARAASFSHYKDKEGVTIYYKAQFPENCFIRTHTLVFYIIAAVFWFAVNAAAITIVLRI